MLLSQLSQQYCWDQIASIVAPHLALLNSFWHQRGVFGSTLNLIKLLQEAGIHLSDDQIIFYTDMNQFQAKARYSEEYEIAEGITTEALSKEYF